MMRDKIGYLIGANPEEEKKLNDWLYFFNDGSEEILWEQLKKEIDDLKNNGTYECPSLGEFLKHAVGIHIMDCAGKILYVNDYLADQLHTTREDLLQESAESLYKFYNMDDLDNFSEKVRRGKCFYGVFALSVKDRNPVWLETRMFPIFGIQKECLYYLVLQMPVLKEDRCKPDMRDLTADDLTLEEQDEFYQYFRLRKCSKDGRYKLIESTAYIDEWMRSYIDIDLEKEFSLEGEADWSFSFLNEMKAMIESQKPFLKRLICSDKIYYLSVTPLQLENGELEFFGLLVNTETKGFIDYATYLQVYYNEITKLPNRKKLEMRDKEIIARYHSKQTFACIYIDLDRFKRNINIYGLKISAAVLVEISRRIASLLPRKSGLYHLDRDEFLIVVAYKSDIEIEELTDQIVTRIGEKICYSLHEIQLTASIGITKFKGYELREIDVLKNTEIALLHAKKQGGDCVYYFTDCMKKEYLRELELEHKLTMAISNGDLELYYQPKFSLFDRRLVGFEALVRWRDGDVMVSPGEFIPIAEESGLIVPLGDFVLKKACWQGRKWLDEGRNPMNIAVNISAMELEKRDLSQRVLRVLEETGFPANMLEIEITENSLVSNVEWARSMLKELRAEGVKISIDDFGKGYSSFSYLHDFPFDTLKIDQVFIKNVSRDRKKESIVRAIIYVGHSFKKKVIAEGVETKEDLEFLQKLNCDAMQGFFLSRPLPLTEIERRYLPTI